MRQDLRTSPEKVTTPADSINSSEHWWERLWSWLFVLPLGLLFKGCLNRSMLLILLSLLLFLLIAWMLRKCDGHQLANEPPGFHYVEPGRNSPPPANPGKIGPGRDSITPIVQDRINVLLEKKDSNTGKEWQMEFKRLYPDPAFQVVYFDSLTYRLQLQVPEEKRDSLMDNLNVQMPQFEFLLFEESVFSASTVSNDPGFSDQMKSWYFRAIKCYEAWNVTQGDPGIIVGVVDNGFDITHPEIATKIIEPFNIALRNQNLYPPHLSSCPGHGTHVAATAVGMMNNGEGVSGIAPECRLIPVQVTDLNGNMTLTNILDGILYAIYRGCNVVNVSLGASIDPSVQNMPPATQLQIIVGLRKNEEQVWNEVFKIANNRNCTLVLAAGNDNVLSGFDAMKRNDETLVVSAADPNLNKADFSNYGNYVDVPFNFSTVTAPGVEIYNASAPDKYQVLQGTSMAAPVVTGAVALMKSLNPNLKTSEIIQILQSTGIPMREPIGPFIQLDKALDAVRSGNYGQQQQAGSNFGNDKDKMKTGDVVKDPSQLYGLWQSTTSLHNKQGEQVQLYMSFSKQRNEFIISELTGERYTAALEVKVKDNNLFIRQLDYAVSAKGNKYQMYEFLCTTDRLGYLQCTATAKDDQSKVEFYLVKIK